MIHPTAPSVFSSSTNPHTLPPSIGLPPMLTLGTVSRPAKGDPRAFKRTEIAIAFATLLAITTPVMTAQAFERNAAQEMLPTSQPVAGWSICQSGSCEWGEGPLPDRHIIAVPGADIMTDEKRDRIRAWEARCHPKPVIDNLGVTRLRYSEKGCEFGN